VGHASAPGRRGGQEPHPSIHLAVRRVIAQGRAHGIVNGIVKTGARLDLGEVPNSWEPLPT
jgi:hypothetical protein